MAISCLLVYLAPVQNLFVCLFIYFCHVIFVSFVLRSEAHSAVGQCPPLQLH